MNGYLPIDLHTCANTVKWTPPNPYLLVSECGSKLYTSFEFYEERNHRHKKKTVLIYKAKQIVVTETIPRKVYIFNKTVQVACK
jgi:hypothetical protein